MGVHVYNVGVLGFVRVFAAGVDIEVTQQLVAQTVFGKHTFYYLVEEVFGALLHEVGRCMQVLAAGITRETNVYAVIPFFAGEFHFVGIDDDDIVAAVYVRSVAGFVFSSQEFGYLGSDATQRLAGGIYHNPLFLGGCLVHRNGLVT